MREIFLSFDQVVHGYRDGHRQLAASLRLDAEAGDAMALASDLLTSRSLRYDEGYITAYPLRSEHKYVFSRTWSAPEMPRPGCVWTHSILLDYVTVSKIEDAGFILSLFRRPTISSLSTYSVPLTYDVDHLPGHRAVIDLTDAEDVVRRVYGTRWSTRDIVLDSRGAERDEQTVFAIWSQMPPRLRRTIAFCTESSSRGLPLEADATMRFTSFHESAVYSKDEFGRVTGSGRGFRLLAKDLTRSHTTLLRRFLRRYSIDVSDSFAAIPVLGEVFLLIGEASGPEDFSEIARVVGRSFTSRQDAQLLKQDLLLGRFFEGRESSGKRTSSFIGTLRSIDRRELLMILPDSAQLADMFLDVASDPLMLAEVVQLRRNEELEELVESCLRHSIELVSLDVLANLPTDDQLAVELAQMRPDLLNHESFWLRNAASRKVLLRSCQLNGESVSCFIRVFHDSLDEEDFDTLLNRDPESVVASVSMLWERDAVPAYVSRMMISQFAQSGELLQRVIANTNVLPRAIWADVGEVLASRLPDSINGPAWVGILQRAHVGHLERHESTLATMLFAEGVRNRTLGVAPLLAVSFDLLYSISWNGALTLQEQKILDQALPGLGTYWSWDYCKRLVRAVLDAVSLESSWERALLEIDVSSLTARGVVREIEQRHDVHDALRSLSEKLDDMPEKRHVWNDAVRDARRYLFRFGPFSF
jgi:hypothetical protein